VYQILSKLVHAFGLQTPITAECSWQPIRVGDVRDMMGCDHPSWVSVDPLVSELIILIVSNIFNHGGRPHFAFKKKLIFDHVTVIVVLICCCIPNFIKIGLRHGNCNMADISGT